jgi:hypothetical protein
MSASGIYYAGTIYSFRILLTFWAISSEARKNVQFLRNEYRRPDTSIGHKFILASTQTAIRCNFVLPS